MNTQTPTHSSRRACGLLLLAWPLLGVAVPLSTAHAQPAALAPTRQHKPLSLEQKVKVKWLMQLASNEQACATTVNVKVQSASLQGVIDQVKKFLPDTTAIEVRQAQPIQVSFDLSNGRAGDVLNNVASLAGCKVFVFVQGSVIAPDSALTEQEQADIKAQKGGAWSKNTLTGGNGWSAEALARPMFAQAIADDLKNQGLIQANTRAENLTVGDLGPESQMLLQRMVDWMNAKAAADMPGCALLQLRVDTPLSIAVSETNIDIGVKSATSQPSIDIGMNTNLK